MSEDGRPGTATEAFIAHRNLLFTVAYEMLGSAAEAEDVLQETWLRWADVDLDTVRDQRAYLVQVATRQALTRLRTLGRRKESYIGPWLPEPLLTTPDVATSTRRHRVQPAARTPPAQLDVAIAVAALGMVAASLMLGRSREPEAVALAEPAIA